MKILKIPPPPARVILYVQTWWDLHLCWSLLGCCCWVEDLRSPGGENNVHSLLHPLPQTVLSGQEQQQVGRGQLQQHPRDLARQARPAVQKF